MKKIIPEQIIGHCKDCSVAPFCDEYKDPYFGEDIPSDCPLKDYREELKPRESVQWFSEQMELTLQKHDDRDGWDSCFFDWLFARLVEETGELGVAIAEGGRDRSKIIKECTDVANFAMMIADKLRFKVPTIKDKE